MNNIAGTYQDLGQNQRALELYGRTLTLAHNTGLKGSESKVLLGMGVTTLALNDYRQARTHFNRAVELAREAKDDQAIGAGLLGLAEIDQTIGDSPQAIATAPARRGARDCRVATAAVSDAPVATLA